MCSCDQSLVTAALLWKKLSQPQFYKDLTRKNIFFEGWSWIKFNNLVLALCTNLKFYTSMVKRDKTKRQANSYVCRSYRGETGRGTLEGHKYAFAFTARTQLLRAFMVKKSILKKLAQILINTCERNHFFH